MDTNDFTRYDIPPTVQHVIDVAIANDVVDAVDVYALAMCHGGNWRNLIRELCTFAFSSIHVDRKKHRAVTQAADEFWKIEINT